jgi:hypothetical protein
MYESSSLQRLPGCLAGQQARGPAPQFFVHERQQLFRRRAVTSRQAFEKQRDLVRDRPGHERLNIPDHWPIRRLALKLRRLE